MSRRPLVVTESFAEDCERYTQGMVSLTEILTKYRISESTFRNRRRALRLTKKARSGRRTKFIDSEQWKNEVSLWQSGEQSLKECLAHLEISKATFYRKKKKTGDRPTNEKENTSE